MLWHYFRKQIIVSSFVGSHIVILGLARQGLALARFFCAQGAQVTVSDLADAAALADELRQLHGLAVELSLGGHPLSLLDACDLLCLSGGVPPQIPIVQQAIARNIPLTNDTLLTLQIVRDRGLGPTIAITGSSGKTTTTTLVGEMLGACGQTVHVGGNIGTPLLDRLDSIQSGEPIVLELSSFQLELYDQALAFGSLAGLGPDIAAILNITPNHLDRHQDMADYAGAKLNLLRHLRAGAALILGAETGRLAREPGPAQSSPLPATWKLAKTLAESRSQLIEADVRQITFGWRQSSPADATVEGELLTLHQQPIARRDAIRLRGDHNVANILAAAAVADTAGAEISAIGSVATTFSGVPHRLEIVAEIDGAVWINDSIATSPERASAALRSFEPGAQTLILLAGGKDKNLPWDHFAEDVINRAQMLIGFGSAGAMIVETVQEHAAAAHRIAPSCAVVQRLDEAVDLAQRATNGNTVVLLSPGGTSYDAYRDFEARGEHFRRLVSEMHSPILNEAHR